MSNSPILDVILRHIPATYLDLVAVELEVAMGIVVVELLAVAVESVSTAFD